MVRLMPKDEKFQELFVDYAQTTLDAARKLEDMVVTYDRLDERVAEIRALEHHGDETQTEVEVRLDRSFITPFDREDIHELVSRMDDVLDRIQEVAETFVIYDVKQPTDDARTPGRHPVRPGGPAERGDREARRAQGPGVEPQGGPRPRERGGRPVPRRRGAPVSRGPRGDRGHQVA